MTDREDRTEPPAERRDTAATRRPRSLLQRVIMPRAADPMTRALALPRRAHRHPARARSRPRPADPPTPTVRLTGSAVSARRLRRHLAHLRGAPEQSEVSFGAYFNAFAAGYWRRWSRLTEVHLRLALEGAGRVDVYRTKADGSHDLRARRGARRAGTPRAGPRAGPAPVRGRRLVLVRPDHRRRRADPARRGLVRGRGGHRPGRGDHRHADLQPAGRLRRHAHRDRRGPAGAGRGDRGDPARPGHPQGPRRARLRRRPRPCSATGCGSSTSPTSAAPAATPGSCTRPWAAPTASRSCSWTTTSCSSPTRCCGPSRSPGSPASRCWSAGRCCRCRPAPSCPRWARWWTATRSCGATPRAPSRTTTWPTAPLRQTPWLHRRIDVDYNAWWMCLIPRAVAEELGLPLPLFIKWDDAEYGLRARSRGYRTATVPGIAIWHMSFLEKDDTSDWQAYFHYRNRFVAAALHGPDNPRPAAARHPQAHPAPPAADGVLRGGAAGDGAARLPGRSGDAVPEAAGGAGRDPGHPRASTTTAARSTRPPQVPPSDLDALAAQVFPEPPTNPVAIARRPGPQRAAQPAPPDPAHQVVPQRNVPSRQAQWFVLSRLDSATVSTPDGRGVTFRRRDPELFRLMLRRVGRPAARHRPGLAGAAAALPGGAARADQPRGLGGARCSTGA